MTERKVPLFDIRLLNKILGTSRFPNSKVDDDALSPSALTRCVGVFGNPSSGKTYWMAKHIVDYALEFPDRPIFVLDVKGSLTNLILKIVLSKPRDVREALISRLVLDALGHPDYVLPTPEFCPETGIPMEDQIQRVAKNLARLNPRAYIPESDNGRNADPGHRP